MMMLRYFTIGFGGKRLEGVAEQRFNDHGHCHI